MSAVTQAGVYEEDFSVPGALVGDTVAVSYSLELQGCTLTAYVPSSNLVRVQLLNNTSASVSLPPGTLKFVITQG